MVHNTLGGFALHNLPRHCHLSGLRQAWFVSVVMFLERLVDYQ